MRYYFGLFGGVLLLVLDSSASSLRLSCRRLLACCRLCGGWLLLLRQGVFVSGALCFSFFVAHARHYITRALACLSHARLHVQPSDKHGALCIFLAVAADGDGASVRRLRDCRSCVPCWLLASQCTSLRGLGTMNWMASRQGGRVTTTSWMALSQDKLRRCIFMEAIAGHVKMPCFGRWLLCGVQASLFLAIHPAAR